jgi:hypothetical protein
MPCHYGTTAEERIPVEFVEADLEIGFSLVDLMDSRPSDALRILADAEAVYRDVLVRVGRLQFAGAPERNSFRPLVEELRRAIDSAQARLRGPNG